jgi:hypothetical protein
MPQIKITEDYEMKRTFKLLVMAILVLSFFIGNSRWS